jgi:hypothetical protein
MNSRRQQAARVALTITALLAASAVTAGIAALLVDIHWVWALGFLCVAAIIAAGIALTLDQPEDE